MRYFEPLSMDCYFGRQDKPTVFLMLGKEVIADDEQLVMALSRLPELRREVLLLFTQRYRTTQKYYDEVIILLGTGLRISEFCISLCYDSLNN